MSAEANAPDQIGADVVFAVDEGDQVHLAHTNHEYAAPIDVDAVDEVEWRVELGEDFRTRRVKLVGKLGGQYRIDVVEGDEEIGVFGGSDVRQGYLTRFDRAGATPEPRSLDEDLTPAVEVRDVAPPVEDPEPPDWTPDSKTFGEVVRPERWGQPNGGEQP
ncbi:MAG: hypothetical protein ABEH81_04150 [Halopenitus sp.]